MSLRVIPNGTGYFVTDGVSRVRTFRTSDYRSRQDCLEDAITYSFTSKIEDIMAHAFLTYVLIEL